MTDLNVLKNRYFVQPGEENLPSEPIPETFDDCRITPIVDGVAFNAEIAAALTMAVGTNSFIYIHNWHLGLVGGNYEASVGTIGSGGPGVIGRDPYYLEGPNPPIGAVPLIDILKQKARDGVDVRVMAWVSFALMDDTTKSFLGRLYAEGMAATNSRSMKSIKDLRAEPAIGNKAILNVIAHTAGAAHTKSIIIANVAASYVVAFTGGIDFVSNRWAHTTHPANELWHDVTAKIEGTAVQSLYNFFYDMWQENITRKPWVFLFEHDAFPSHLPRTPPIAGISLPTPGPLARHSVESLRTVPRFNYSRLNLMPENPPISFARDGLFEFRLAMWKALSGAQTYIYIEDQALWSFDLMRLVRAAMLRERNLVVIMVMPGRFDPDDPRFPLAYLSNAINGGLLDNASEPDILARVRLFRRDDITIHSKTVLIDDNCALLGSANFMMRSLYTDLEHHLCVVDPDDTFVREYRKVLWNDQFRHTNPADLDDLQQSLHVWDSRWGNPGSPVLFPADLLPYGPPIDPDTPLQGLKKTKYEKFDDLDSRQTWRFP